MVKVRENSPEDAADIDIHSWVQQLRVLPNDELLDVDEPQLVKACEFARACEQSQGDPETSWGEGNTSFLAGLHMAELLADMHLDGEAIIAAVLYRSVREAKATEQQVLELFGEDVISLINGVRRMAAITARSSQSQEQVFGRDSDEQAEKLRKLLVAIVDDVRIALIKLVERTCAIRAVKNADAERRKKVAREVSDIYAPLAHRLGIGQIKWELEDLSFRYLQPFDYKYIAKLLDEKRLDRESYIARVIELIRSKLGEEGIAADVSGRPKHIYSIWRKMKRKNVSFAEIYDIRAVRVLVNSERDCYGALGIVHSLWRHIPHEMDDYIANAKENGYRSLHTAVHGPENRVLEIQIRTHAMHDEAEYGVCSHWRYKKTDVNDGEAGYEQKIAWLRQVIEWQESDIGVAWDDQLPKGIEQDRIYVFTPDGHVVDLPPGATPVDFAFRIHTDVGLRCRGAKINGRIVPLNHTLSTADQVEIMTANRAYPSRDWLNSNLGYITTSKARNRLQHWFKLQDRDQNIADGRALLDHEFRRLALENFDFDALAKSLNLKGLDDLYAAVGVADLGVEKVIDAANRMLNRDKDVEPVVNIVGKVSDSHSGADVYIDGVGNLLSYIAQCCKPVPGERIAGYITLGRGVSIHRQDCSNLLRHIEDEPERVIAVDWAEEPSEKYSAVIEVEAFDRHGLLRDITTLLDRERINVSAMQTFSNKKKHTVDMMLTVEVTDLQDLSRILARINQLPNIWSVRRKD
ncbi:GTP diphosphokinase [Agaribacterium haliotis]|uniref:GTP diphosphokinase n=1 Tax=Agaribacterium haliotis TaxID=2013869 RepID=UPI000BB588D8|nr:GTP diphosphokinase [Agaribacterium haliotis]